MSLDNESGRKRERATLKLVAGQVLGREPVEHRKLDSQRAEWRIDVPAGGTRTLTYRVRYAW